MAFKEITLLKRPSDLIIHEYFGNYNFDDANITPPAASAIVPLGTIVFRAKGLAVGAAWTVLTAANATASVITGNEFGVVYGDGYGWKCDFAPEPIVANRFNAVVIKRGPAMFKEFYIKEVYKTALAATYPVLIALLADQGLVVLEDVTDLKVV